MAALPVVRSQPWRAVGVKSTANPTTTCSPGWLAALSPHTLSQPQLRSAKCGIPRPTGSTSSLRQAVKLAALPSLEAVLDKAKDLPSQSLAAVEKAVKNPRALLNTSRFDRQGVGKTKNTRPPFKDAARLVALAGPLWIQYIIGYLSTMIDTAFVGHQENPVMLSSMVLATSLAHATGYTVTCGIASGLSTVCGQAFGAKNYKGMNITLQRALAIGYTCLLPMTALWLNSAWILEHLGQDADIAAGASTYLIWTLPALYMHFLHESLDKFLLSQQVVKPSLAITAFSTAITPLYCWFFVAHMHMGLHGAALAYDCSMGTMTSLILGYTLWRERQQAQKQVPEHVPLQPSAEALTNWGSYVNLAVPAILMSCVETWALEVLIFESGMLPNAEVAVGLMGLSMQMSTLVWMAAASIGGATSTRVSIKLGRGDGEAAKRSAQAGVAMVISTQLLLGSLAFSNRDQLIGLMTNNTDVITLFSAVMPLMACCFMSDGLNVVLSSVLSGAGRQWMGAKLNLLGWWLVGIPVATFLAFHEHQGVQGIWTGFTSASAMQSMILLYAVSTFDWDAEVQRAAALVAKSSGADPQLPVEGAAAGVAVAAAETSENVRNKLESALTTAAAGASLSAPAPASVSASTTQGLPASPSSIPGLPLPGSFSDMLTVAGPSIGRPSLVIPADSSCEEDDFSDDMSDRRMADGIRRMPEAVTTSMRSSNTTGSSSSSSSGGSGGGGGGCMADWSTSPATYGGSVLEEDQVGDDDGYVLEPVPPVRDSGEWEAPKRLPLWLRSTSSVDDV